MSGPQRLSSRDNYESLIDKYDTWMFDCDGVLWRGNVPVEGAVEVLQLLRSRSQLAITISSIDRAVYFDDDPIV